MGRYDQAVDVRRRLGKRNEALVLADKSDRIFHRLRESASRKPATAAAVIEICSSQSPLFVIQRSVRTYRLLPPISSSANRGRSIPDQAMASRAA